MRVRASSPAARFTARLEVLGAPSLQPLAIPRGEPLPRVHEERFPERWPQQPDCNVEPDAGGPELAQEIELEQGGGPRVRHGVRRRLPGRLLAAEGVGEGLDEGLGARGHAANLGSWSG